MRQLIEFLVLDALANDIETIEQILDLLNHDAVGWRGANGGRLFGRSDVVAPLLKIVREGLVEAFELAPSGSSLTTLGVGVLPPSSLEAYWFGLTPAGRLVHTNWDPPSAAGRDHDLPSNDR